MSGLSRWRAIMDPIMAGVNRRWLEAELGTNERTLRRRIAKPSHGLVNFAEMCVTLGVSGGEIVELVRIAGGEPHSDLDSVDLTIAEYDRQAEWTADYPGTGTERGLHYSALGLCGEAGEVAEKLKKVIRDDGGVISPETRDALVLELGDVLWYVSAAARDLGVSLEHVAASNTAKLRRRTTDGTIGGSGDNR